ncbi:transmembrane protein 241 isoform X3 [Perca flavescens]|uniref:transmembrane protein 241 isoform X3 n=1 Tax=Perca flavescens TaxID=8167 RepID=UPI00106DDBBF|nr:transmembrane protein 241 isoform X3 [Perca flavescens]
MQWKRHITGVAFSIVFVVSYFTNKFVLSVLKFTYPTLFQGWQTFIGAVLLLLSGKFGWVEMSRINRSAALSWLPGSLLFVGKIYAGSRALSRIDIPIFFTLQNSSHVVSYIILKVFHREKTQWLKLISICLMLLSAINLPLHDLQFDYSGYLWAVGHLLCVGAYRVFQVHYKSSNLSVLLLAIAAHPTGDLTGAMEFPSLQSHTFHCGCCARLLPCSSLRLFSTWTLILHLLFVLSLVMLERPCWCILTETLSCDEEIAALQIDPQLAVLKEIFFSRKMYFIFGTLFL